MANIRQYDDLYTGMIAYAMLVSCIALVLVILGVRALCSAWLEGEMDRKLADAHYVSADNEIREQKARLDGYRKETVEVTISSEDGQSSEITEEQRLRIPIERAKVIVLKELAKAGE